MITIFVGDTTEYLSDLAKAVSPHAMLLSANNNKVQPNRVYYTSLGEFNHPDEFVKVLLCATTIIYSPPEHWTNSELEKHTLTLLTQIVNIATIKNLPSIPPKVPYHVIHLQDYRQSDPPQLWISGCSISYGTGINDNQRYGELLSQKLNMPVSWLTAEGSSIAWQASQILRADLRSGDIVVWGLTAIKRYFYFTEHDCYFVGPGWAKSTTENIDYVCINAFSDPEKEHPNDQKYLERCLDIDTDYQSVLRILEVENFCQKVGVKLVLVDLFWDNFINYFKNNPRYILLTPAPSKYHPFPEVGIDGCHPGPETHVWYADEIYKKLSSC